MKTLKEILSEAMGEVTFSGILKLKLDPQTAMSIRKLEEDLPPEANALSPEDLHVTLIHQDVLRPYKAELKSADLSHLEVPKVVVTDKIYKIERPSRTSWISVLANQNEMQKFVGDFMQKLGAPSSERRVYHITIANLTGATDASVGDVQRKDIIGRNLVSNVLQDSENSVE